MPQFPQACCSVALGAQAPSPSQAPNVPHRHWSEQTRVVLPQLPHARSSVAPGTHWPGSSHAPQSFHAQVSAHTRVCWLQALPPSHRSLWLLLGTQSPSPSQAPSAPHVPSLVQARSADPQRPHASERVSPAVQLQSEGAVHGSQSPLPHVLVPSPHSLEHGATVPGMTSGSWSSQSDDTG